MLDRSIGLPAKYIQGPGALDRIGAVAVKLGSTALVIADEFVLNLVGERIVNSLEVEGIRHEITKFNGECCRSEIDRLSALASSSNLGTIIAVGGGKVLDTGKAVAAAINGKIISAPTVASTDGPTSSIAVEYSEDHVHIGVMRFNQSPSVVLVDSTVISQAPPRLLVAGMGDALATWFEGRACSKAGRTNFAGDAISDVSLTLARACHDTIMTYGRSALAAVQQQTVTEALEKVIEANIFLSGVGFENTGVAAAHALDTAISRFTSDHRAQHGERVAVGVLFQLILEGAEEDLELLLPFYNDVGLPKTLTDVGLTDLSDDELTRLTNLLLRENSPIRNLPFEVTSVAIFKALKRLQ